MIGVLALVVLVAVLVGVDVRRDTWDPWDEFDEYAEGWPA